MEKENATIHDIPVDVGDYASVQAFARQAVEKAGPPSILVNNAGLALFQDIGKMTPEDFDKQIDATLKGPWYMTKEAVPGMKQLGSGHIINISSIAGRVAFKRGAAYNAAKGGMNLMMEALMLELREHNIKVSTIAPGSVDTSFHQQALPQQNQKDTS